MNINPEETIQSAVEAVFDSHPALASMLAKLNLIPDDSVVAFATNGVNLSYSPAFVKAGALMNPPGPLSISEAEWIIIHELGHIFLGHHLRIGNETVTARDNAAADLALNSLMSQLGVTPSERLKEFILAPGKGEFTNLPHGKDFEWYRDNIPDNQQQKKKKQSGSGSQSDSGKENESVSQGKEPGEKISIGSLQPHPAKSESEKKEAEEDWKESVASAVNAAKECGSLPGWMSSVAQKAYGEPVLDWRAALRRFMTSVAPFGTSWARPSRRQFDSKLMFPCNISQGAGEGLVLVDTSSSMNDAQCNIALRELEVILASFPLAKVTMRQCDTRVITEAERVFTKTDFPLRVPGKWFGRGGTNLCGAFAQARSERGKFKWMVIVSDMIWPASQATDPGIPCIWLVTAKSVYSRPTFGTLTFVK